MLRSIIKNLSLALMLGAMVVGCGGSEKKGTDNNGGTTVGPVDAGNQGETMGEVPDWYSNPDSIKGGLFGIGVATMNTVRSEKFARKEAMLSARAELAASIRIRIQSISKNWQESSGDASDADTIQELYRSETFERGLVNEVLENTKVYKTAVPSKLPGAYRVLVGVAPAEALQAYKSAVQKTNKKRAVAKETYVKSKIVEDQLDALIAKEEAKLDAAHKSASQTYNFKQ
ncbi:MAG: hypothetical protein P1V97_07110 [Planctomycetota bacterium]|nr:hypothetical protein [Planctomycetota bacterium]